MTVIINKGEFEIISNTFKSQLNKWVYETVSLIGDKNGFDVLVFKGRYPENPCIRKHFDNVDDARVEFKNQNAFDWAIKKTLEKAMTESGLSK